MQSERPEFDPCVQKVPWRKEWLPASVFLSEEFHGQKSLVSYSPWVCKELDMIEKLYGFNSPVYGIASFYKGG